MIHQTLKPKLQNQSKRAQMILICPLEVKQLMDKLA